MSENPQPVWETTKPQGIVEPVWKPTNDEKALEPTRVHYCPICANADPPTKSKLVMRRSRIHTVADVRIAGRDKGITTRPYACDLAFKCPVCDYYCVFGVPLDMEYAQERIRERDGSIDYVLPDDTWNENGEVKSRLEKLGYW